MADIETAAPEHRRHYHDAAFKERIIAECAAGASAGSVAVAHGLPKSTVNAWVRRARAAEALASRRPGFIAVMPALPQASKARHPGDGIEVSVRGDGFQIDIRWPVIEAGSLALWAREMLR